MNKLGNTASYTGIGVMSGTSGDGIDLCRVGFTGNLKTEIWSHEVLEAITVPYTEEWKTKMCNFDSLSSYGIIRLHFEYGHLLGQLVRGFISGHDVDFVASHGHTVFHKPEEGVTFQLGDGETMATYLEQPLVTGLRYKDIALRGQGAPIVPFGEKRLFSQYDICLNLGGICNISMHDLGFDVTPCNMALNQLAHAHDPNIQYDDGGRIAKSGVVIEHMLDSLNRLEFYQRKPPKSLGREWFEDHIQPIIDENIRKYTVKDLLCTFVEHITFQITQTIELTTNTPKPTNPISPLTILLSGGGALNTFLVQTLKKQLDNCSIRSNIQATNKETVDYKESIIMAFLGMYSLLGQPNILSSGTGASSDSISGSIHWPPKWTSKCDLWK